MRGSVRRNEDREVTIAPNPRVPRNGESRLYPEKKENMVLHLFLKSPQLLIGDVVMLHLQKWILPSSSSLA